MFARICLQKLWIIYCIYIFYASFSLVISPRCPCSSMIWAFWRNAHWKGRSHQCRCRHTILTSFTGIAIHCLNIRSCLTYGSGASLRGSDPGHHIVLYCFAAEEQWQREPVTRASPGSPGTRMECPLGWERRDIPGVLWDGQIWPVTGINRWLVARGIYAGQSSKQNSQALRVVCAVHEARMDFTGRWSSKTPRRRRHEGMSGYIIRKAEVYSRACQTLERVQKRSQSRGLVRLLNYYPPSFRGGSCCRTLVWKHTSATWWWRPWRVASQWNVWLKSCAISGPTMNFDNETKEFVAQLEPWMSSMMMMDKMILPRWSSMALPRLEWMMGASCLMLMESAEEEAQHSLALMEQGRKTLYERPEPSSIKSRWAVNSTEQTPEPSVDQDLLEFWVASVWSECGEGHKSSRMTCLSQWEPWGSAPESAHVTQGLASEEAMLQGKATLKKLALWDEWLPWESDGSQSAAKRKQKVESQLPVFGFGNSSTDRCLSTAWLQVNAERGGVENSYPWSRFELHFVFHRNPSLSWRHRKTW